MSSTELLEAASNSYILNEAVDFSVNPEITVGLRDKDTGAVTSYIYKKYAPKIIEEGLNIADYSSGYDHPDKYQPMYSFGETVKVRRSFYTHWKNTVSTCMTFGFRYRTLQKDIEDFLRYPHTLDHNLFINFYYFLK